MGITDNIRNHFSLRWYNLIIGAIFTGTSFAGYFFGYFQGFFQLWPRWPLLLTFAALVIAVTIFAKLFRDSAPLQVAAYGAAVFPMAALFSAYLLNMFPNATWDVYSAADKAAAVKNNPSLEGSSSLNITYNLADCVLAAALICSIALAVLTIWSFLLEKWMRRPKTAAIMAAVSYVIALLISTAIYETGTRIFNLWTILFSLIPLAYLTFTWSYQTGGPITFERACGTPICTFLQVIDAAQAVND